MTKGALEDTFVYKEFEKLIKLFNINKIIETGTCYGWSTLKLAEFGIDVLTIENVKENYLKANESFSKSEFKNITSILGNSPDILNEILEDNQSDIILFLDAHWHDYWPLRDELRVCVNKKIKPVIVIHDFFVPNENGGAKFGYDTYGSQNLNLDYIKNLLNEIYGENNYDYYYNSESDNVGQGVIYIHRKNG